ncbi:MAG: alpha/beta hydrolase [Chloroflexi bacterium]|nr:MAG: alpha/beta hydrolase [Chloroflexota bacterium]
MTRSEVQVPHRPPFVGCFLFEIIFSARGMMTNMNRMGEGIGDRSSRRNSASIILKSMIAALKNSLKIATAAFFVLMSQIAIAGVLYDIIAASQLLLLSVVVYIGLSLYAARKKYVNRSDKAIYYRFFAARAITGMLFLACLFHSNQMGTTFLSLFLGAVPGQFLIIGIVGMVIGAAAFHKRSFRFALVMILTSIVTVVSATVVLSAQVSFAKNSGVEVASQELWSSEDPLPRSPSSIVSFPAADNKKLSALLWRSTVETIATRPVVVMLHGGGFASGSPADMTPTASMLADRGYTVFSVEYRLAPPERWKDATDDIVRFLQWLEVNRVKQGIASTKVVLLGNSAGGSLALNVAYGLKSGQIDTGDFAPVSPVGVVGLYPAADLGKLYDSTMYQDPRPVLSSYIGGSPSEVAAQWTYADPAKKIVAGLPPTLLVTGASDHLVYAAHVQAFSEKVASLGNDVQMYTIPYADHSFDARYNSPGSAIKRGVLLRWLDQLSH